MIASLGLIVTSALWLGVLPLSECEMGQPFELARDRIGDANVLAGGCEELSASKQKWCFCWWCAINISHLKSKAVKLPSCFVNEVRNNAVKKMVILLALGPLKSNWKSPLSIRLVVNGRRQ